MTAVNLRVQNIMGILSQPVRPSPNKMWDQTSKLLEILEVMLVDILLRMMRHYFNMLVMAHNGTTTFESKYRGRILYFCPLLPRLFLLPDAAAVGNSDLSRVTGGSD